jgi:hypothetical protein
VAGVLGAALLVASVALPWFQVPDASIHDRSVVVAVIGRPAPASLGFKAVLVLAAIAAVVVARRRSWDVDRACRTVAVGCGVLLGVLIFFPHAVMVWCPASAGRANWLHVQHRSLTWFGGDVFGLQETKDRDWKSRVPAADVLDQATALNTPSLDPAPVPFGNLQDLSQWFGYSNAFCQFARIGWGLGIGGCMILVVASLRRRGDLDVSLLRSTLAASGITVATGCALALAPAVLAGIQLDRARAAAVRGEAGLALDRIDLATRLLPILRQSSDVTLERGLLEARLGIPSPEAALYGAKVLQRDGRYEEADSIYGSLVVSDDSGDAVLREAARGLLRRGIRQFNSGEASASIASLEAVLRADPCNVKANYVLQLAYLRAGRFDALRDIAGRMRDTYHFFSDDTKLPILAAMQENLAIADYLNGEPAAALAAWQTLGDPKRIGGL